MNEINETTGRKVETQIETGLFETETFDWNYQKDRHKIAGAGQAPSHGPAR